MKQILYILLALSTLSACQQHELAEHEECILELDIVRAHMPVVATRAIDTDLAIIILDDKGEEYLRYPAGEVPNKIVLRPGLFAIRAYTDNQTTWHTANNGKGEGCYYASQLVQMEDDHTTRLTLSVPMTNYAVGVEFPDLFDELFTSYQLTLKSGSREVIIRDGENAYFSVADGGFTYALSVTNADGSSYEHSPTQVTDVENGKCYLLKYNYGFDTEPNAISIEIASDFK